MFQRAFVSFLALVSLAGFAIYWLHIRIQPEDVPAYHKLIQEDAEMRTHHALEDQPAEQLRKGVQKDIWSIDESRHFQIQSEYSELTLSCKEGKFEAIEKLKQVRCSIQDIDSPIYTLTADEGIYSFPSQQFTAQTNCSLIQEQNRIDGKRIDFDFSSEIIVYEEPKGHLSTFDFSSEKLIWHKKEGKLFLIDRVQIEQPNRFILEADQGLLTLDQFEPKLLVLEGNIRLVSSKPEMEESFAAADRATYDPQEKTLLLSSDKKVLFWQEGLRLSASEVLIRQDPLTNSQTVKGLGDVHFSFDLEEQNYIEELFKHYL